MINFGKSVNKVIIPELAEDLVFASLQDAYKNFFVEQDSNLLESLDYYYNQNLDKHLEQWFASDSLSQVPPFISSCVPRFAKARMMLYKEAPQRLIAGEINEDYNNLTFKLNSKTREFAELSWLLGKCWFKTIYNTKKERLEYEILPQVHEYFIEGEREPYGYSYEIESTERNKRFVFWSEDRENVKGMHFEFDDRGHRFPVYGNEDMINPYGINPITKVDFNSNAYDVTRASLHIAMAMTEIALGVRFKLGQPVFIGVEEGQSKLKSGVDNAIILPHEASFKYESPDADLNELIEAVKLMANTTAENHQLRIRWGESIGNAPSGEALKILEIENLESRKSDESLFREWELERYNVDKVILETHNKVILSDDYIVDFGEVSYPMSAKEEREWLDWKLSKGIMSQKELLLYFNPDMSEIEIEDKLNKISEEKRTQAELEKPQSEFQRLLS